MRAGTSDPDIFLAEPLLKLDDVMDAERRAWHLTAGGEVDYLFDGINFWCVEPGRACTQQEWDVVPREGWRHLLDCRCRLCGRAA